MRLQISRAKNGFFILQIAGGDQYIVQPHEDQDAADKELGLQLRTAFDEWQKDGGEDEPEPASRRAPRAEVVDEPEEGDGYEGSIFEAIGEAGKLLQSVSGKFPSRHRRRRAEPKED